MSEELITQDKTSTSNVPECVLQIDTVAFDYFAYSEEIAMDAGVTVHEVLNDLDDLLVHVAIKWPDGNFCFYPKLPNSLHAVFWLIDSVAFPILPGAKICVFPCEHSVSECAYIETDTAKWLDCADYFMGVASHVR
ncbi:MAG: hypothetical protein CBC48_21340 [bacterium TMED88]|nr:MAG: hypothetical protein CBC48_21340 [bacterium TMED88]